MLPKPLILSSHLAGWDNFCFAYHRQSPYDIPETYPSQYTINIYTSPFLAVSRLSATLSKLKRYDRNNAVK